MNKFTKVRFLLSHLCPTAKISINRGQGRIYDLHINIDNYPITLHFVESGAVWGEKKYTLVSSRNRIASNSEDEITRVFIEELRHLI